MFAHGQRECGATCVVRMKPVVSGKALQAAVVVFGGILVIVGEALVGVPGLIDPRWAVLIATIGGLLAGKEGMSRTNDIPINQLPLDWQERKTDPQ